MKDASSYLSSLDPRHILFVQAKGNYLYIHFEGNRSKQLIRATLKSVESQFNVDTLVRVHNSYLVHLTKVIKIQSRQLYLFYNDKRFTIPVSRKYLKDVKSKLEEILTSEREILYTANDPGYPF